MQFFYAEQEQRLECLNHETVRFADVACQMADLFGKTQDGTAQSAGRAARRLRVDRTGRVASIFTVSCDG